MSKDAKVGLGMSEDDKIRLWMSKDAKVRLGISKDTKVGLWMSKDCLLYTSPSPRDQRGSRMPSSA